MGSKLTIAERVKEVIVNTLDINPDLVTSSASFTEDLDCDDLDQIELMEAVSDEFGVDISEEVAARIHWVRDLVSAVKEEMGDD